MILTPDRVEQKTIEALNKSGYYVTMDRRVVEMMLTLLRSQQAEIERLTAENQRLQEGAY